MTAIVYGFVRAASDGWTERWTMASFVAGVLLLAAFVMTEMRAEQPITPLRLFADRSRAGAYVTRLFVVGGMFSFFFFISQYLQGIRDYSAAEGRARVPADDPVALRHGAGGSEVLGRASATPNSSPAEF